MSNYVRGLKRQQIINRWLQGHDDPDFEVFPTKKEGKFIVKKRAEPLEQTNDEEQQEEHEEEQDDQHEEEQNEEEVKPKSNPKSKPAPKPKPVPKHKRMTSTTNNNDLTVGLEILEQIKLLGEEMKHQRKKKEQKEFVKQVVQKQLNKKPQRKVIQKEGSSSRGRSPYSSDEYEDEEESQPEPQKQEPEPEPKPVFRSRIRNPKL